MRIVTGYLKSRSLKFPKCIRPTQEKIRKAIFDILGDSIKNSQFLELFAGSGAVGIEALSNLCREVVFVENNNICLKILRSNLRTLNLTNYQLINSDVVRAIEYLNKISKKFDFIFLDPPYFSRQAEKTLKIISQCDILQPSGIIIVEHHRKDFIDKEYANLFLCKQKKYSDKILSFFERKEVSKEADR